MNGTASDRTIRLSAALALCPLSLGCGTESPASPTPVGPAHGSPSPTPPPEPGADSFTPLAGGVELLVGAGDITTCDPHADVHAANAEAILSAREWESIPAYGEGDRGMGRCH
jgi:hypothetical protein